MEKSDNNNMELLAPAGNLAAYEAAVDAGANAVFVGAPSFHARALGRDFSMAEIAAMIDHAHRKGVKLYLAMNSLVKEEEIPLAVKTLAILEEMGPDALIIQDLGLWQLARKYFPGLRLHASTLMGAHNSLAVKQFEEMGFSRVVLARELGIREIEHIRRRSGVELEVFVHGALCFSYSGLCLFSSYLGGKSSLRGRCVQPCRRRYGMGVKGKGGGGSGYLFSMNDLAAIDLLPQLRDAGITSLKIEGRLRSAGYVESVVRAYRLMLDAMTADDSTRDAVSREAHDLLGQAMGRRTSTGYFVQPKTEDIIVSHHSGNIGHFLGRVERLSREGQAELVVKSEVRVGDRLRCHQEKTGERFSVTLKNMYIAGREVCEAERGTTVSFSIDGNVRRGDSLYRVDTAERRSVEGRGSGLDVERYKKVIEKGNYQKKVERILRYVLETGPAGDVRDKMRKVHRPAPRPKKKKGEPLAGGLDCWLRIEDFTILKQHLPFKPGRLLVTLDRDMYALFTRQRNYLKPYLRDITWALPPVILERDVDFYDKTIRQMRRSGFRSWQLGHLGQRQFFQGREPLELTGDYTLNVLNSLSLSALKNLGLKSGQAGIETDRQNLEKLCANLPGSMGLGLTVYGKPPLFTARLTNGHFRYDRSFTSPKDEHFTLKRKWGLTLAVAQQPFSLLPMLTELANMGVHYVVVDLSHQKLKERDLEALGRQLRGQDRRRIYSSFNYGGVLF